jgi:serine phosphatase RsbU (regulator of sigma subunit)
LIAIGDVSGKGMKAAMIVSLIIGTLRTIVSYTRDPAEILKQLNFRLHSPISGGFVTCLVLRIGTGGQIIAANAGHIAPYLHGKEMEQVGGSLPLGIVPELTYDQVTLRLSEGDTMTLLTDTTQLA